MRREIIFFGSDLDLDKLKEVLKINGLSGKFRVKKFTKKVTNIEEAYELMKILEESDLFATELGKFDTFTENSILVPISTIIKRNKYNRLVGTYALF